MLDLYWRYLTDGVVDITSVISRQATDQEGASDQGVSRPSTVEDVTLGGTVVTGCGSEVTTSAMQSAYPSGEGENRPPRAGRSRSSRPSRHIPTGTQSPSSKGRPWTWNVVTACEHEPVRQGCTCGLIVGSDGPAARMAAACRPPEMHSFGLWPVAAVVDPRAWCQCGAVQRGRVPER